MKIIKPGRKGQKSWAREFECTGAGNGGFGGACGAILLVEQDDVFITHSYHYDGSHETYTTFECAQCRCRTDIPSKISMPFTPMDVKECEKINGHRKTQEST